MIHDPLCVKTEDPYSMKTCQCDLIAKVRQDERERAGTPSREYPFTTRVRQSTTEMQRWGHPDPDGSMHLYPLGPYVLYDEAEAAIAAAKEDLAKRVIQMADVAAAMASDDMLAKCVTVVEEIIPDDMRALEQKP